jgi:hypothetical protein
MKETTVWKEVVRQPNHTYLADENKRKIYGYFKFSNPKDFQMFKKPITIDTRYRSFKVVKDNLTFKAV